MKFICIFSYRILKKYFNMENMNITLTFSDVAENHPKMQQIGNLVDAGHGFQREDLLQLKEQFELNNLTCELISLDLNNEIIDESACVLVIRRGLLFLLEFEGHSMHDLFMEHSRLDIDRKAFMRGEVKNKLARGNLCFGDENQEPDYENKKGRIVAYRDIEVTNKLKEDIELFYGKKARKLQCEGNYYFDPNKCGIGFHGDGERRKVIGVRIANEEKESSPLHFQWFQNSTPIGQRFIVPLNAGDIYVMGEKAVGTDWMKRKIPTLRHATGCAKYTTISQKEEEK